MKKLRMLVVGCILMLLVLGMSACEPSPEPLPKFESEDAMRAHLNGMWAATSEYGTEYYIFQENAVYVIEYWEFGDIMEEYFADILDQYGLDTLICVDYQTVLEELGTEGILGEPQNNAVMDPINGIVSLNRRHIATDGETVRVKYESEDDGLILTKISETADFTGENFENLLEDIKKNYTIPASKFWVDTKEYAESIKDSVMTYGWRLVSKDAESEVYSLDIPNQTGVFSVNMESLLYSETFSYSTYFGTEKMSFLIMYDPYADDKSKSEFTITDTASPNPSVMIEHAAFVTQNFPGAPEFESLYNMLMNAAADVSGSTMTVEKTVRGISYKLSMGTDGSWAQIFVDAPQSFKLAEIMEYYTPEQPVCIHDYTQATCTKPATCNRCGATQGTTEHSWTAILETIDGETLVVGYRCTLCDATK